MDIMEVVKAAADTGAWGLLAVFLIKYFIDDKAKTIERIETTHKEALKLEFLYCVCFVMSIPATVNKIRS